MADHETQWDHRGIYAEYAAVRLFEYQRVGTIGPGKSLAVAAEPFEQAIYRMAGFHALAPPRSYHGRHLRAGAASRKRRVPPRSWCRFQADAAAGLLSNWPPSAAPTNGRR